MSGSPRSGFTWKAVADVLRVSQISDEIKRQRKEGMGAKRTSVDTNDAQSTSNQAQFRRPGASR